MGFSKEKQVFGVDKKADTFLFQNSFNTNEISIFVDFSLQIESDTCMSIQTQI